MISLPVMKASLLWLLALSAVALAADKRIVLIGGDEEYRSEEALPQLARILSERHGFQCTVLLAPDPNERGNIPGLEALDAADLMVIFTRFRDLPDAQMKHIVDYVESGRPVIGIRTATHAFDIGPGKTYSRYSWNSREWDGGFGRQVLGETWIAHHGEHGKQSTRCVIAKAQAGHPVLRGIGDGAIWAPTDVYKVRLPLAGDAVPLVFGQVLDGMTPQAAPAVGAKNDPMMPVAWVRTYKGARVFTTTMGSAQDLENAAFRRLLVNACYWALGMKTPAKTNVDLVGEYKASPFGMRAK